MTVLASTILTRVRRQLIDEKTTQRWTDIELLGWLSDGQRAIVAISPSYGEVTETFVLAAGTRQALPADTQTLLNIPRNLSPDGQTPGRAIRVTDREALDTFNPDWHSTIQTTVVENYVFDPERQKVFYVYPPNNGTGAVELSRAVMPAEITDVTQPLAVSDLCQTALFDYVMFRAHQKDSDYAAGDSKAQIYLGLFNAFMGVQGQSVLAESPNASLGPADLTNKGTAK